MIQGKKPLCPGVPKSASLQVDWKCGTHLHLPVGHVMHAILDAMEDAVELQWEHM
jgi:hypothetical protein